MASPPPASHDEPPHRGSAPADGPAVRPDAPRQEQGDPALEAYRRSIDNIDAALIHMLAERFRITQAVGEYKAQRKMAPADPVREHRQVMRLRRLAEEADLDPEFSEKFIRFVIDEVIRHHQRAREAGR